MDSSDLAALEEMLAKTLTLEDKTSSEEIFESITHYFRELRTLCTKGAIYQDTIAESNIVQHAAEILNKLVKDEVVLHCEPALTCIRVGIQFFGNFVVDNIRTKSIMWQQHRLLLRDTLSLSDVKAANYAAMVIFNLLKDNNTISLEEVEQLFPSVLEVAAKESEFGLFCLELILCKSGLLPRVYHSLSLGERLFILEVSRETLSRGTPLPPDALIVLTSEFKMRADAIFMTLNSTATPEPTESAALLETIATASGLAESDAARAIKEDGSLLTSAVFLLRGVHQCFAVEEKITSLDPLGARQPELRQSPVYGFKAQLVRLIGNLCWQHRLNQDKVRDMEGIPLLLNCSKLDACNPFITQWVVLAIRNLCEGNLENQNLIASLQCEGNSPVFNSDMALRLKPNDQDSSKMNIM